MDLNCKIIILVVNNTKEYDENLQGSFLFHNSHQLCVCECANFKVTSANKQQVPKAQ